MKGGIPHLIKPANFYFLKIGLIPSNYIEMKPHNWYYGRITRADAEKLLANKHEGILFSYRFLIPDCPNFPQNLQ